MKLIENHGSIYGYYKNRLGSYHNFLCRKPGYSLSWTFYNEFDDKTIKLEAYPIAIESRKLAILEHSVFGNKDFNQYNLNFLGTIRPKGQFYKDKENDWECICVDQIYTLGVRKSQDLCSNSPSQRTAGMSELHLISRTYCLKKDMVKIHGIIKAITFIKKSGVFLKNIA